MKHSLTTKEFKRLSKSKRAVLVAKDVIKQIKAGVLRARHTYCSINYGKLSLDTDVATALRKGEVKCQACARGALFLSTVKFKNVLQLGDISNHYFSYYPSDDTWSSDKHTVYLSDEFSREQQALIETAYEGREYGKLSDFKNIDEYNKQINKSLEFNKLILSKYKKLPKPRTYKKDAYLLIAICNNIIKNLGVFKP